MEDFESEAAKVTAWRLQILMDAGYPAEEAERLAESDVDLHKAVLLVHQVVSKGLAPSVAAEILA